MASKLVKRAERQQKTIRNQGRRLKEAEAGTPLTYGLAITGAAAAGYIDRPGAQLMIPDDIMGIPTSAAVGAILATTSLLWLKMPAREVLGPLGLGMACGQAYSMGKGE